MDQMTPLSRRIGCAAALVGSTAFLAACGTSAGPTAPTSTEAGHTTSSQVVAAEPPPQYCANVKRMLATPVPPNVTFGDVAKAAKPVVAASPPDVKPFWQRFETELEATPYVPVGQMTIAWEQAAQYSAQQLLVVVNGLGACGVDLSGLQ
jgi:hypothetical protein